jgi:hypothetical protein
VLFIVDFYTSCSYIVYFAQINVFTHFRDVEKTVYSANRGPRVVDVRESELAIVCAARGGLTSSVRGTHGRIRQNAIANKGRRSPMATHGRQPSGSSDTGRATNSERDIPCGVSSLESSLDVFAALLPDESAKEAFRKALIEHDNSIRVVQDNIEVIEKQIADSQAECSIPKFNPKVRNPNLLAPLDYSLDSTS